MTVPQSFRFSRHFAAWIGLTPRTNSSGGKERLGPISKQGNTMLRSFLVLGAIARLRDVRSSAGREGWMSALLARRPYKVAAVAVANKLAQIAWALINTGKLPRPDPNNAFCRNRHCRRPRCTTMMNANIR